MYRVSCVAVFLFNPRGNNGEVGRVCTIILCFFICLFVCVLAYRRVGVEDKARQLKNAYCCLVRNYF